MSTFRRSKFRCYVIAIISFVATAHADEGFWLYSQVPVEDISAHYGIRLTPSWLERLQKATVRFNVKRFNTYVGGSGSFVSEDGLVLTNLHVIPRDILDRLSTADRDIARDGFLASARDQELKIPGLTLDALLSVTDVTERVLASAAEASGGREAERVRSRTIKSLEEEAAASAVTTAEVVALFGGAQYLLYRHRRYSDVRLVFAPEAMVANRPGDYPAPSFDVAFVRAYEDGLPARPEHHLEWSKRQPLDGDVIFLSGAPTTSRRHLTVAELETQRDIELPFWVEAYSRLESRLSQLRGRSADNFIGVEPTLAKIRFARQFIADSLASSRDSAFLCERLNHEREVIKVLKDRGDTESLAAFHAIGEIESTHARDFLIGELLPWGGDVGPLPWEGKVARLPSGADLAGPLYAYGQVILRARRERKKPDGTRIRGYNESDRAELEQWLFGPQPINLDVEAERFAAYLDILAERLGANDPVTRIALGGKSSTERAGDLIRTTRLGDAAFRRALYHSDDSAFDTISDPLLDMLRALESDHRRIGLAYDANKALLFEARAQALQASSRVRGQSMYADATRTVRFGYGTVADSHTQLSKVPATTSIGAIYEWTRRSDSERSYSPPPRWVRAKSSVIQSVPLNFLSTVDIVGGHSGSATVDADGRIIGVPFGPRAIQGSAAFDYAYDAGEQRRTVHVSTLAIIEALTHVYDAQELVGELLRSDR